MSEMVEASKMADAAKEASSEVRRNYEAFMQKLPELLPVQRGKFALMHDASIVEFFDTAPDAFRAGKKLYAEGSFSIQEVTDSVADLGFLSHALPER
jgi:hypothetical protein